MAGGEDRCIEPTVHGALSRRERLDCRQCSVICEQVVSPWRCLATQHGCVYAYEEGENTYFGCLHKIFSPELDMAAFAGGGPPTTLGDPYGALRVVRTPRPQCPVTVERAYAAMQSRERCVNLAFGDPQGANGIMELQERDAEGRDGRQGRRGSAG